MRKIACIFMMTVSIGPVLSMTASAEEVSGKTDLISDMHKPFYTRQQAKDAERVKQLQDVTGQEWMELTLGERMDHVLAAIYVLKAYGVAPRRTLNEYCNAVERALVLHSDWTDREVTTILASVIYDKEPASRPVLDKFTSERS